MAPTIFSWRHLAVCELDRTLFKPFISRYRQYFEGVKWYLN